MLSVENRITQPVDARTVSSLNRKQMGPVSARSALSLNRVTGTLRGPAPAAAAGQAPSRPVSQPRPQPTPQPVSRPAPQPVPPQPRPQPQPVQPVQPQPAPAPAPQIQDKRVPALVHPLQRGQKTSLVSPGSPAVQKLNVCVGWNVKDARCDVDASAFLVCANGKVPGDEWFVFYGQNTSPDGSVIFRNTPPAAEDRQVIAVDLTQLNPQITRIVFVLTINEAFEQNLNFSMLKDAYLRVMDPAAKRELVSYQLTDYYPNVTSMTIGELYCHKGEWKFNPVGNGVRQDLAGQCAIYGVQIE